MDQFLSSKMSSSVRYGAAPSPKIPPYYIKISAMGTSPPGAFVYPTPIKGDFSKEQQQQMGIAVKRFYFLKNKDDLSYCMSDDGKGQIAEMSKDNSFVLSLDDAVNLVNGLLLQLQRNGFTQEQVLATPLP